MMITVSQQSTFQQYAAKVLSTFFISVVFDVPIPIMPLAGTFFAFITQ